MDRWPLTFGQRQTTRRTLLAGAAGIAAFRMIVPGAYAQGTASPAASPFAASGDARERLRGVLSFLPPELVQAGSDGNPFFDWLDYQRHFVAHGVDDPYDPSVEIGRYMSAVGSGDPLFLYALNPEIEELVGFRLFNVHQVVSAGTPPGMWTVYQGGVDFDAVTGVWESSGYSLVSGDHGEYWSKAEGHSVDVEDPLSKLVLARWNNLAVIGGTTLVTAPTAQMIERTLESYATEAESAADSPNIAPLIDSMPVDTVNVMAFTGDVLSRSGITPDIMSEAALERMDQEFVESDEAVGPMPPVLSAMGGVTAGVMAPEESGDTTGLEDVMAFMSFLTASDEDARQAAEVAFWRIDNMVSMVTGVPYAELLDVTNSPEDAADGSVMTVELGPMGAVRSMWYQLFFNRDVAPFAR